MALVVRGESLKGRSHSDDPEEATYERTYIVVATTNTASEADIWALTALPQPYSTCPDNPLAIMIARTAKRDDNAPKKWECTFKWSTKGRDPSQISTPTASENPTERLTKKVWSTQARSRALLVDVYGQGLVNSCGGPIEGVTVDESAATISYTWNQAPEPGDVFAFYADSINDASWQGGAAYTWKVVDCNAEDDFQQGIYFWRVTMKFAYDRQTWVHKELDRGFTFLGTDAVERIWRGPRNTGDIPSEPVLLNGKGEPLYYFFNPDLDPLVDPTDCRMQNRRTTLQAGITATETQIQIPTSGFDRFPTPPFYAQIASSSGLGRVIPTDEIVLVAEATTPTLYRIERAAQGTLARSHTANAKIYMAPIYFEWFLNYARPFSLLAIP